jgi:hypothetical protein
MGRWESRDSLVGTATGNGLGGRGLITGRGKRFFSSQRPDRLWGTRNFLSNGYRGSFLGGKAAGAWSWPLTSVSCRSQEWWSYTSTPQLVFMAWCLINNRGTFAFYGTMAKVTWMGSWTEILFMQETISHAIRSSLGAQRLGDYLRRWQQV